MHPAYQFSLFNIFSTCFKNKGPFVSDCAGQDMEGVGDEVDTEDEIAAMYRSQIRSSVHDEAQRRLALQLDPYEEARLNRASITALVGCSNFGDNADADSVHGDLVPALMARLGDVRSALTGHGGGLVVISAELQAIDAAILVTAGSEAEEVTEAAAAVAAEVAESTVAGEAEEAAEVAEVAEAAKGGIVGEPESGSAVPVEQVSLLLSLDGACISCGAAPGTLSGIRDDLLADPEISDIAFDRNLLDHYDGLAREFLEMASGVMFR
jgi:hypothetical protein